MATGLPQDSVCACRHLNGTMGHDDANDRWISYPYVADYIGLLDSENVEPPADNPS